jgi:glucosamine--fructose-6-phosphate aminotransferase (isomerizing)
MALAGYADEYFALEDKTFVVATKNRVKLYSLNHEPLITQYSIIDMYQTLAEKGEFNHFMLKEINEQPGVIKRIISNHFIDKEIQISNDIIQAISESDRIYIISA